MNQHELAKLKRTALGLTVIVLALVMMWNVARFEINTAIEMATTPWQKSVNQHISAVFAVLTMIIVAVIIALRETGKQRWIWYGTPIFVILIAFEYSSAIHYLNKMAFDYSASQKETSVAKQSIDAAFAKLNPASAAVEIDDINTSEQVLELNKQAALAEKELIRCNTVKGWRAKTNCQTKWEANLKKANVQLSGIAQMQSETHLKHSERIAEVNALVGLRNLAIKEEKREIPLPVFKMIFKDSDEEALAFQETAFKLIAGAIVTVNSGLFFLGIGLIGNVKLSSESTQGQPLKVHNQPMRKPVETWANGAKSGWSAIGSMFNKAKERLNKNTATAFAPDHFPTPPAEKDFYAGQAEPIESNHKAETKPDDREHILNGIGFSAPIVKNPNYTPTPKPVESKPVQTDEPVAVEVINEPVEVKPVPIYRYIPEQGLINVYTNNPVEAQSNSLDCLDDPVIDQLDEPQLEEGELDEPQPIESTQQQNGGGNGRGESVLFVYEDLVEAVVKDDKLFYRGVISQDRVRKFIRKNIKFAIEAIDRLKEDGYLNERGEKVRQDEQVKRIKGWLKRLFCRHNFFCARMQHTREDMKNGTYGEVYICLKCGKKKNQFRLTNERF